MEQWTESAVAAADNGHDDDALVIAHLRARCEQLSQKCDIYEQEVSRLRSKLERFVHEVRQHCPRFQSTRDVAGANRSRSASAASGLQPIAACPHVHHR